MSKLDQVCCFPQISGISYKYVCRSYSHMRLVWHHKQPHHHPHMSTLKHNTPHTHPYVYPPFPTPFPPPLPHTHTHTLLVIITCSKQLPVNPIALATLMACSLWIPGKKQTNKHTLSNAVLDTTIKPRIWAYNISTENDLQLVDIK